MNVNIPNMMDLVEALNQSRGRKTPLRHQPREMERNEMSIRILCRSCEALAINGVACHERGCPSSDERWVAKGRGENKRLMPESQELPEDRKSVV